ncbi:MAG: Gfo/Idh/MocA family oxidoreductase [Kiritimatiellia bacterium]
MYGFAILGTGLIARFHAKAVSDVSGAKLVGVCSRSQERAGAFAEEFGCCAYVNLERMLRNDSVDVLLVATPSGLHMEPTLAAARAGKHVLCEKPLEITPARIQNMIEAHRNAGTQLGCIFQMRHFPVLEPVREALRKKRFGRITHAAVYIPWWRSAEYYSESEWHGTKELDGGGALMNQSIHMIDLLCSMMPPVASVSAVLSSLGHPGIEVEDCASASILFEGGALGTVVGSTSSWPGRPKRLEITGTAGTVVIEDDNLLCFDFRDAEAQDEAIRRMFSAGADRAGAADPGAMTHAGHSACISDFVRALRENRPCEVNGVEAGKSVALIDAIYRSAKMRAAVDFRGM